MRYFESSLCGIAHSESISLVASANTISSGFLKFKAVFVIKFSAKHLLETKKTANKPPIRKMFLKWFQYCYLPSRKTIFDSWFHDHFQLHEHRAEEIYDKKHNTDWRIRHCHSNWKTLCSIYIRGKIYQVSYVCRSGLEGGRKGNVVHWIRRGHGLAKKIPTDWTT